MSDAETDVMRQLVSWPGGSCNMKYGPGAIERLGRDLAVLVGRPRLALVVCGPDANPELVRHVTRLLSDADFEWRVVEAPVGESACSLEGVSSLHAEFAKAGITADDVVVAVGAVSCLSVSAFAAGTWCGGVALAEIPTTLEAAVACPATPRALDSGGMSEMVCGAAYPQMMVVDSQVIDGRGDLASSNSVRALLVQTAMADEESAVRRLAKAAPAFAAGDEKVVRDEVMEAAKARGRLVSSTSIAVRQAPLYGLTFARALAECLPGSADRGLLLAEGLRFESRVSAGLEELDPDFVFLQDDMLDDLGLDVIPCDVDPTDLLDAIKGERFRRTNRFMLALPLSPGRVRLNQVEEDLLTEHLVAWCDLHRDLAMGVGSRLGDGDGDLFDDDSNDAAGDSDYLSDEDIDAE